MRAFAGESQARNRYTIAAGIAHKSGLAVIQGLFLFTAEQEKTHAKQFYRQLHDLSGQTVRVDGTYPVDLYTDLLDYLRAAQHNEYQEWEHDYAAFARTAMEEGFPLVGKLFENIAGVEKLHGDRFGRYADLLEQEQLFVSDVKAGVDVSALRLCGGCHCRSRELPCVPSSTGVLYSGRTDTLLQEWMPIIITKVLNYGGAFRDRMRPLFFENTQLLTYIFT